MKNKIFKFGLYTSFYNAEKFIDRIFDFVSKINYSDFEWIITDDFSKDNTKNLLLEKIKNYNFVKYIEQNYKKEMYWEPNKFFNESFDYIVLLDCDDDFDFNFLNIYNQFANQFPEAVLFTSDFVKKENNLFHSLSLVKNEYNLIDKLKFFHPQINYLKNISYNCLGHLRCFKNIRNLNFEIKDFDACAEDSYRMMFLNSFGKWLHIPRNLYQWNLRSNSESHSVAKENFNGNFKVAYDRMIGNCFDPYYFFNDIYKETSALSILGINEISNKRISIFSKNLSNEQKNKIRNLYSDCKIDFDKYDNCDIYVFVCDYFLNCTFLDQMLKLIKTSNINVNNKVVLYYQEDSDFDNSEQMKNYINKNFDILKSKVDNNYCSYYSYFMYFRHNYIIA